MRQHAISKEEYIAALTKPVVRMGIEVGIALLCWTLVEAFGTSWPWWLHYSVLAVAFLTLLDGYFGRASSPSGASIALFAATGLPLAIATIAFGRRWRDLSPEHHFLVPLVALCILIPGTFFVYRFQRDKAVREMQERDVVDELTELTRIEEAKKNAANESNSSSTAEAARRINQNGEIE